MKAKTLVKSILMILFVAIFFIVNTDINAQRRVKRKPYKKVVHVHPPKGAVKVVHRSANYHFIDGLFYTLKKDKYVVVKSPIGIRVSVIPSRAKVVFVDGVKHHYYYGTYYRYLPEVKVYEVVENPKTNTVVMDEVVLVDGRTLEGFYLGGTQSIIQFEVDSEVLEIPIEDIVSINYVPSEE